MTKRKVSVGVRPRGWGMIVVPRPFLRTARTAGIARVGGRWEGLPKDVDQLPRTGWGGRVIWQLRGRPHGLLGKWG